MWTSERRLYLTPDGTVSEDPVSGGSLLVPAGGELSNDDAERYGLLGSKGVKPAENKARKGKQNKTASGEQPGGGDPGETSGEE